MVDRSPKEVLDGLIGSLVVHLWQRERLTRVVRDDLRTLLDPAGG
jgi:hypothetical protein